MGELVAVCRVHTLLPDPGSVGVTAIDKRPVQGPVKVGDFGLYGDVQADRRDHGGLDKAVYAYSEESTAQWSGLLGAQIAPGTFGENLRTSGVDVDGALIGERWQVGDSVLLEVTSPRIPCGTFGRWLDQPSWPRRFTELGLPGAYLRVVARGHVSAGDPVVVVHRPDHGVTIARWFTERSPRDAETLDAADRSGAVRLAPNLRFFVDLALTRA